MRKRSSILLIVVLGAALLYRNRHRSSLQRIRANVRAFDLPTAGMYDALVASVLSGLYERVADEVAASLPTGTLLEIGSGPGRLAVLVAQRAPGLEAVGVDISPEMVERAARRVEEAGLGERVRFEVGDVGALPFPNVSFDGAVSTLSLHHWQDPACGLAEIHRVLKPGAEARIYDLAHWLWRPARGASQLGRLVAEGAFNGEVEVVRWPGSVPAFAVLRLRRL